MATTHKFGRNCLSHGLLVVVFLLLISSNADAAKKKKRSPTKKPPTTKKPAAPIKPVPPYKPVAPYKPAAPYNPVLPSKTVSNLAEQFMGPQNAARSLLRMAPLLWDNNLARYAQQYAEQRRYDCDLVHSNGPYGENIFWGGGSGWTPSQASQDWVSERYDYNYQYNSCRGGEECGHYTQIVWRATSRIGCARVDCYSGLGVFMICSYDPPGNYIGERPY